MMKPSVAETLALAEYARADGRYSDAIAYFETAYAQIDSLSEHNHAEVFTRLPLVYQQAGNAEKGWQLLNQLLESGCAGRTIDNDPVIYFQDRAAIFDRMRLFLARERRYKEAVPYDILYFLSQIRALYLAGETKKIKSLRATRTLEGLLRPALTRAQCLVALNECIQMTKTWINENAEVPPEDVISRISTLLNND